MKSCYFIYKATAQQEPTWMQIKYIKREWVLLTILPGCIIAIVSSTLCAYRRRRYDDATDDCIDDEEWKHERDWNVR